MLTKGDDYPIHQTPEPIAFSGTDRNFYDRYFFNGYQPDGTEFFAVAFGVVDVSGLCAAADEGALEEGERRRGRLRKRRRRRRRGTGRGGEGKRADDRVPARRLRGRG